MKIVARQDTQTNTRTRWSIYRSDDIGAIEWPFFRWTKRYERPTEQQVRRIIKGYDYPIEYQDMNGIRM